MGKQQKSITCSMSEAALVIENYRNSVTKLCQLKTTVQIMNRSGNATAEDIVKLVIEAFDEFDADVKPNVKSMLLED